MREGTRGSTGKSSELLWETLEKTIRGKVQEFIQEILEEEVTDFLGGRRKSQRKSSAEGDPKGYRNGYGKPRNLTLASGTVEVRRPRVRDVEERFESRVLPLFERRTKESAELVVQLYLHGLAEGDFELASGPRRGRCGPRRGSSGAGTTRWPTCSTVCRSGSGSGRRRCCGRCGVGGCGRSGSRALRGPLRRRLPQGCRDPGGRLGPDDRVLRFSRRPLDAPAHDERGREPEEERRAA